MFILFNLTYEESSLSEFNHVSTPLTLYKKSTKPQTSSLRTPYLNLLLQLLNDRKFLVRTSWGTNEYYISLLKSLVSRFLRSNQTDLLTLGHCLYVSFCSDTLRSIDHRHPEPTSQVSSGRGEGWRVEVRNLYHPSVYLGQSPVVRHWVVYVDSPTLFSLLPTKNTKSPDSLLDALSFNEVTKINFGMTLDQKGLPLSFPFFYYIGKRTCNFRLSLYLSWETLLVHSSDTEGSRQGVRPTVPSLKNKKGRLQLTYTSISPWFLYCNFTLHRGPVDEVDARVGDGR